MFIEKANSFLGNPDHKFLLPIHLLAGHLYPPNPIAIKANLIAKCKILHTASFFLHYCRAEFCTFLSFLSFSPRFNGILCLNNP